ncbi:hypothetical protein B0T25DRAFT_531062 [Lasiosphaeria hispida]|uniref:Uncharacterized protein n=1 Tax=Lasiosphaeria hispida TaxID=260671 RepID=A0AAJ0HNX5_9PEZI|nr:hypothetical protein B0T25DRAFT_531062 [Lasiosphaeria hispida]
MVSVADWIFLSYESTCGEYSTRRLGCTDGGTFFTLTGAGVKNNFGSTPQIDVLVTKLSPNFHLTLYTGRDQSGVRTQIGQDSVGLCKTHRVGEAGWLSFGLSCN